MIGVSGCLLFGGVGYSGNYWLSGYFVVDYCLYLVVFFELIECIMLNKRMLGIDF